MSGNDATGVCLVTGGAGFIGCAVSGELTERFARVVTFDNMHPQVHPSRVRPAGLHEDVELVQGDVTSPSDWDGLLSDVRPDLVLHLAAETGTGQSLLEASRHAAVNVVGTTQMLDALVRHDAIPRRILLTSSRAVYGEGAWQGEDGTRSYPGQRSDDMLARGEWDFPGLVCQPFSSADVEPRPTSVYGSTKLAQEHILLCWGRSVGVDVVNYRLQNVYGPGQSLINPYTGIVSLFARLAKEGTSIPVYEDGEIVRDFVFIDDVATALMCGLDQPTNEDAFDIGSGEPTTILDLARLIASIYGAPEPHINGKYRNGDVRASRGDIRASSTRLGWKPGVSLDEGVRRLCSWIDEQP